MARQFLLIKKKGGAKKPAKKCIVPKKKPAKKKSVKKPIKVVSFEDPKVKTVKKKPKLIIKKKTEPKVEPKAKPAKKKPKLIIKKKEEPKKEEVKPAKKKRSSPASSPWFKHLAEFRKANPTVGACDVMKQAKLTYKATNPRVKTDRSKDPNYVYNEKTKRYNKKKVKKGKKSVKKEEVPAPIQTELKPKEPMTITKTSTGEVIPLKLKEKKGGDVPLQVPLVQQRPETSVEEQQRILADIISSYDEYNKKFQDISNSNLPITNKRDAYENERQALETYNTSVFSTYGSTLSPKQMNYQTKAYQYDIDTYKIGLNSLQNGLPRNPVNFENFEEAEEEAYAIDHSYKPPATSLDRAESFYAHEPVLVGKKNPQVVVPMLGSNASTYPYGDVSMKGGAHKSKEELKQILAKKIKDMFVRDMKKLRPSLTDSKIIEVYNKHKDKIQDMAGNAIISLISKGGCNKSLGGIICPPGQYQDGNNCYNKEARMDVFNRNDYIDNQTNQSQQNALKPVSAPLSFVSGTKSSVDDPNPPPAQSTGAIEDIISSITPPDKGIIFGTNMDDAGSIKDWIDTVATIGEKTIDGVASVFKALNPLSWI